MDKGVVYQIPCAQCNEVYNGKTGRPLETRNSAQKSSGHRWCMECQRYPLDEDKSQHGLGGSTRSGQVIWKERKIKDSVYIRTRRTYNMDWGSFLWFQKVEHEQKERVCRNVPWEGYIWQCYLVKRELYLVDRSCPNHEGQDQKGACSKAPSQTSSQGACLDSYIEKRSHCSICVFDQMIDGPLYVSILEDPFYSSWWKLSRSLLVYGRQWTKTY